MNIHRLRVVDYDTPVRKLEGTSTIIEHDEDSGTSEKDHTTAKVIFDSKPNTTSEENGGGDQNATTDSVTCPTVSKRLCLLKRRSKSELFRLPSQLKSTKYTPKNVASSEDLKKSSKHNDHTNHRSRYNLVFNRDSILNLHSKGGDVKANKKYSKKKEEPSFLPDKETPKLAAKVKTQGREKNNNCKVPKDAFGFQKSNRHFDPCLYQMSCHFLDLDNHSAFNMLRKRFRYKQSRKKQKQHEKQQTDQSKDLKYIHHKFRVLNSQEFKRPEADDTYYNITDNESPRKTQPIRKIYKDTWRRNYTNLNLRKDANVFVSSSVLVPKTKYCVERACGCSRPEIPTEEPSCSQNKDPCITKCESETSERRKLITGLVNSITSCTTVLPTKNTTKISMKNICLGLLIIVWSPCLLAVILALIIMSPWRVSKLLDNDTSKTACPKNSLLDKCKPKCLLHECQRICSSYTRSHQTGVLSSVAGWFTRAADTAAASLQATLSLVKLNKNRHPTCAGSAFVPKAPRPTCKYPNPKVRYNLYYAHDRGWVMKPAHHNRQYQNMRCEYSPKMQSTSRRSKKARKSDNICCTSKDMILEVKHSKPSECSCAEMLAKNKADDCRCTAPDQPTFPCSSKPKQVNITSRQNSPIVDPKIKPDALCSCMHNQILTNKNTIKLGQTACIPLNPIPHYCVGMLYGITTNFNCGIHSHDIGQHKVQPINKANNLQTVVQTEQTSVNVKKHQSTSVEDISYSPRTSKKQTQLVQKQQSRRTQTVHTPKKGQPTKSYPSPQARGLLNQALRLVDIDFPLKTNSYQQTSLPRTPYASKIDLFRVLQSQSSKYFANKIRSSSPDDTTRRLVSKAISYTPVLTDNPTINNDDKNLRTKSVRYKSVVDKYHAGVPSKESPFFKTDSKWACAIENLTDRGSSSKTMKAAQAPRKQSMNYEKSCNFSQTKKSAFMVQSQGTMFPSTTILQSVKIKESRKPTRFMSLLSGKRNQKSLEVIAKLSNCPCDFNNPTELPSCKKIVVCPCNKHQTKSSKVLPFIKAIAFSYKHVLKSTRQRKGSTRVSSPCPCEEHRSPVCPPSSSAIHHPPSRSTVSESLENIKCPCDIAVSVPRKCFSIDNRQDLKSRTSQLLQKGSKITHKSIKITTSPPLDEDVNESDESKSTTSMENVPHKRLTETKKTITSTSLENMNESQNNVKSASKSLNKVSTRHTGSKKTHTSSMEKVTDTLTKATSTRLSLQQVSKRLTKMMKSTSTSIDETTELQTKTISTKQTTESQTKSISTEKSTESETKTISIKKSIESQIKSISSIEPADSQTKTISTKKPAESETKTVGTQKPIESQTKTIRTKNPTESQIKTISTKKPAESQTKTISTKKPAESETKTVGTQKPIESQTKTIRTKNPTESQTKTVSTQKLAESQTKTISTRKPAESQTKTVGTQKLAESQTKTISTKKPPESQTKTVGTQKLAESQTKTISTKKPAESQTKTVSTQKPTESQTKTITTKKPADSPTKTVGTQKLAESQTKTISTKKPTESQTKTVGTQRPTESQTKTITTKDSTESQTKTIITKIPTETQTKTISESPSETTSIEKLPKSSHQTKNQSTLLDESDLPKAESVEKYSPPIIEPRKSCFTNSKAKLTETSTGSVQCACNKALDRANECACKMASLRLAKNILDTPCPCMLNRKHGKTCLPDSDTNTVENAPERSLTKTKSGKACPCILAKGCPIAEPDQDGNAEIIKISPSMKTKTDLSKKFLESMSSTIRYLRSDQIGSKKMLDKACPCKLSNQCPQSQSLKAVTSLAIKKSKSQAAKSKKRADCDCKTGATQTIICMKKLDKPCPCINDNSILPTCRSCQVEDQKSLPVKKMAVYGPIKKKSDKACPCELSKQFGMLPSCKSCQAEAGQPILVKKMSATELTKMMLASSLAKQMSDKACPCALVKKYPELCNTKARGTSLVPKQTSEIASNQSDTALPLEKPIEDGFADSETKDTTLDKTDTNYKEECLQIDLPKRSLNEASSFHGRFSKNVVISKQTNQLSKASQASPRKSLKQFSRINTIKSQSRKTLVTSSGRKKLSNQNRSTSISSMYTRRTKPSRKSPSKLSQNSPSQIPSIPHSRISSQNRYKTSMNVRHTKPPDKQYTQHSYQRTLLSPQDQSTPKASKTLLKPVSTTGSLSYKQSVVTKTSSTKISSQRSNLSYNRLKLSSKCNMNHRNPIIRKNEEFGSRQHVPTQRLIVSHDHTTQSEFKQQFASHRISRRPHNKQQNRTIPQKRISDCLCSDDELHDQTILSAKLLSESISSRHLSKVTSHNFIKQAQRLYNRKSKLSHYGVRAVPSQTYIRSKIRSSNFYKAKQASLSSQFTSHKILNISKTKLVKKHSPMHPRPMNRSLKVAGPWAYIPNEPSCSTIYNQTSSEDSKYSHEIPLLNNLPNTPIIATYGANKSAWFSKKPAQYLQKSILEKQLSKSRFSQLVKQAMHSKSTQIHITPRPAKIDKCTDLPQTRNMIKLTNKCNQTSKHLFFVTDNMSKRYSGPTRRLHSQFPFTQKTILKDSPQQIFSQHSPSNQVAFPRRDQGTGMSGLRISIRSKQKPTESYHNPIFVNKSVENRLETIQGQQSVPQRQIEPIVTAHIPQNRLQYPPFYISPYSNMFALPCQGGGLETPQQTGSLPHGFGCPLAKQDDPGLPQGLGCPVGKENDSALPQEFGCPLGKLIDPGLPQGFGCPLRKPHDPGLLQGFGCPLRKPNDPGLPQGFGCPLGKPNDSGLPQGFGCSLANDPCFGPIFKKQQTSQTLDKNKKISPNFSTNKQNSKEVQCECYDKKPSKKSQCENTHVQTESIKCRCDKNGPIRKVASKVKCLCSTQTQTPEEITCMCDDKHCPYLQQSEKRADKQKDPLKKVQRESLTQKFPLVECACKKSPLVECLCETSKNVECLCKKSPLVECLCKTSKNVECLCKTSKNVECLCKTSKNVECLCKKSPLVECLCKTSKNVECLCKTSTNVECLCKKSKNVECLCKTSTNVECLCKKSPNIECLCKTSPLVECLCKKSSLVKASSKKSHTQIPYIPGPGAPLVYQKPVKAPKPQKSKIEVLPQKDDHGRPKKKKTTINKADLERGIERGIERQRKLMTLKQKKIKDKIKEKERKKAKSGHNISCWEQIKEGIKESEEQAWPLEITCDPLYIHTLKHKPHLWVFKMCPSLYPHFLNVYKVHTCMCQMLMYLLTALSCCPVCLCLYFCCRQLFCGLTG